MALSSQDDATCSWLPVLPKRGNWAGRLPRLSSHLSPLYACRTHSCWFFAEEPKLKADHVRASFGNLERETVVAKYAARQGLVSLRPIRFNEVPLTGDGSSQPFSSTKPVNIVCKLRKPMADVMNGQ
jgi:hypothetical protein